jgi:uncharacterized RDD family membrane protein YckC
MQPTPYAGLVTRGIALLVDAVVINVIAAITGAVIGLIGSLLGVGKPGIVAALTGGVVWLAWTGLYFIVFWTIAGQTPGARLLGIRVVPDSVRRLGIVRATLRFVVMMLALVPLGAGFLTVLFDERRCGPHDMVAATVVRWASLAPAPPDGLRVEHELIDTALEAGELDRRRAGSLLAGGIAFRVFLWLLPAAVFAAGVIGLVRPTGSAQPDRVAQTLGLGASVTAIVRQATKESHHGTALLLASGLVLTLYASTSLVRALRIAHVLAWEEPSKRRSHLIRDGAILSVVLLATIAIESTVSYLRHQVGVGPSLPLGLIPGCDRRRALGRDLVDAPPRGRSLDRTATRSRTARCVVRGAALRHRVLLRPEADQSPGTIWLARHGRDPTGVAVPDLARDGLLGVLKRRPLAAKERRGDLRRVVASG